MINMKLLNIVLIVIFVAIIIGILFTLSIYKTPGPNSGKITPENYSQSSFQEPSSCMVIRNPFVRFNGTCVNKTPEYVATFSNKTSVLYNIFNSSLSNQPPTIGDTDSYWFFLIRPYNESGYFACNFLAHKWYNLVEVDTIVGNSGKILGGVATNYYLNGKLNNSIDCMLSSPIASLAIPTPGFASNLSYYGYVSNFQYYNTSLSTQQIISIYNEGLGSIPVNLTNLIEWFPLNNNTLDYSGNNQTFIYSNMTFTNAYEK